MRKQFLFLFLASVMTSVVQAQSRSTRIGFIDMEYILEKVSDYKEATAQLEIKAQLWKKDIATKKLGIDKLRESLKIEKPLLTKDLIEEREAEIKVLENELTSFQEKQFGTGGNFLTQKAALAKPIQDQVFTAVQDIAEAKNYDFIFDKSSDFTMLFAAKRFDISDQVIRALNRTDKRQQLSKKQLKEEEVKESNEDAMDENPALAERKKILDDRKAAREKLLEERKTAQAAKIKEYEDKKQAAAALREAKKNGTVSEKNNNESSVNNEPSQTNIKNDDDVLAKEKALERQRLYDERKKELEEKKQQILRDREALRKAKELEQESKKKTNTTNN